MPPPNTKPHGHGNSSSCCRECCSKGSPANDCCPRQIGETAFSSSKPGNGPISSAKQVHPLQPNNGSTMPKLMRSAEHKRARHLVHLGELSAARQALTANPTAPGNEQTLQELQDPGPSATGTIPTGQLRHHRVPAGPATGIIHGDHRQQPPPHQERSSPRPLGPHSRHTPTHA